MPEANVTKLRQDYEERNVATQVSLVVGVTDNAQMTFVTGFEGDDPDHVVNARLDRLMTFAERLKAKASIPQLEDDLLKQSETLAQFQEDLARVDLEHGRAQALRRLEIDERIKAFDDALKAFTDEIDGRIAELDTAKARVFEAGLAEHTAAGRHGAYAPRGAVASQLDRFSDALKQATENRQHAIQDFAQAYATETQVKEGEIVQADAEREQAIQGLNISIKRYTAAIEATTEKLAKARALAGG